MGCGFSACLRCHTGWRLPPARRRLDALIIAGSDKEQIEATPRIVERFPPDLVLWAGERRSGYAARSLLERLDLVPVDAQAGQVLDLGEGARLEFLAVGQRGAVLCLAWRNFSALLPIGLDFKTLDALQNDSTLVPVTALLLADSGSAPLNPPGWIEKLRPQVALLSVSAADMVGLPSPETLEALEGYTLLRTDRNGWIEISTDGVRMWVEVERK